MTIHDDDTMLVVVVVRVRNIVVDVAVNSSRRGVPIVIRRANAARRNTFEFDC
jgi:hypothetical protein